MRLAPVQRRSPRELGEELAAAAVGLDEVERAEVAGPGFVNFWLSDAWFAEALGEILEGGTGYGGGSAATPGKVQVEMVSANPTRPVTGAPGRDGAIRDSGARQLGGAGPGGSGG